MKCHNKFSYSSRVPIQTPDEIIPLAHRKSLVVQADSCGPEPAGFLEVQRWMSGIRLQQLEFLSRPFFGWDWSIHTALGQTINRCHNFSLPHIYTSADNRFAPTNANTTTILPHGINSADHIAGTDIIARTESFIRAPYAITFTVPRNCIADTYHTLGKPCFGTEQYRIAGANITPRASCISISQKPINSLFSFYIDS